MRSLFNSSLCAVSLLTLMICGAESQAAGMVPESSVVFVNAGDGEGTINVTNTDSKTALLYTSLENVPDDKEDILVVTPPVARVEAGEKQLVRFILQTQAPITVQRLKRVNFEGIPQKESDGKSVIGVTVRQNLAVLISPADLPEKTDPWSLLTWSVKGRDLMVRNDSRYVVRMNQQIRVLPAGVDLMLPRTYILPGQSDHFELPAGTSLGSDAAVRIYPASVYGFAAKPFDAPLSKQ